jgi:hypothetical protein
MRCPLCDQLYREHTVACQAEATATLEQRHDTILVPQPEGISHEVLSGDTSQRLEETILSSRKKQLRIRSHIQQHKALAHSA